MESGALFFRQWERLLTLHQSNLLNDKFLQNYCILNMGVFALHQKKCGKVLKVLCIVYIGYIVVNIVTSMQYGFSASALTYLAILIVAFVLSQKSSDSTVFDTKDTSSGVAKVLTYEKKQISIYNEQLPKGILTHEEYDQIMNNGVR